MFCGLVPLQIIVNFVNSKFDMHTFQKKAKGHKKTPNNASDYLEQVDDHYEMLYVTEDNSLRRFIEKKKKIFARGCAYYELTNDMKTDIDSEKEVILMDEVRS